MPSQLKGSRTAFVVRSLDLFTAAPDLKSGCQRWAHVKLHRIAQDLGQWRRLHAFTDKTHAGHLLFAFGHQFCRAFWGDAKILESHGQPAWSHSRGAHSYGNFFEGGQFAVKMTGNSRGS